MKRLHCSLTLKIYATNFKTVITSIQVSGTGSTPLRDYCRAHPLATHTHRPSAGRLKLGVVKTGTFSIPFRNATKSYLQNTKLHNVVYMFSAQMH